jgi:hypothetical protein
MLSDQFPLVSHFPPPEVIQLLVWAPARPVPVKNRRSSEQRVFAADRPETAWMRDIMNPFLPESAPSNASPPGIKADKKPPVEPIKAGLGRAGATDAH